MLLSFLIEENKTKIEHLHLIEIQGTTLNFCPKNLGIFVSGFGQLQGFFGT